MNLINWGLLIWKLNLADIIFLPVQKGASERPFRALQYHFVLHFCLEASIIATIRVNSNL